MKRLFWLTALASVSFIAPTLSASVLGTLTENACAAGGVTVTATTITWSPAGTLAGTGCINSGIGTNLTWSGGGSLGPGVNGNIKNLTIGGGAVDQFMTFPAVALPTLDFVLTLLGPGSSNVGAAGCAAANANGLSCSVVGGSPFILTYDNGSTDIALHALGTIADPNAPTQTSTWSGGFSVTVAGKAPIDVYNMFVANGNIAVGQQGQFVVASAPGVPEPGTIGMMLLGVALLASAGKRKAKV